MRPPAPPRAPVVDGRFAAAAAAVAAAAAARGTGVRAGGGEDVEGKEDNDEDEDADADAALLSALAFIDELHLPLDDALGGGGAHSTVTAPVDALAALAALQQQQSQPLRQAAVGERAYAAPAPGPPMLPTFSRGFSSTNNNSNTSTIGTIGSSSLVGRKVQQLLKKTAAAKKKSRTTAASTVNSTTTGIATSVFGASNEGSVGGVSGQSGVIGSAGRDAIQGAGGAKSKFISTRSSSSSSNLSNRARDARKEELIYLRKKVAELEQQLVESRQRHEQLQHARGAWRHLSAPPHHQYQQQPRPNQHLEHGQCELSAESYAMGTVTMPQPQPQPRPQMAAACGANEGETVQPSCASASRDDRYTRSSKRRGATGSKRQEPQPTSLWQEIVSRQYEQRVKAERENIRLKLVLENQLKVARGLEKMLQKTTNTKASTSSAAEFEKILCGTKRFRWAMDSPVPPPDESDARLVSELLAGLDESYLEAEAVFEANGLARATGSSARIDVVVRPDEHFGIQLEVFARKVLPFDMRSAAAVVWNHYAHSKDRLPNRVYRRNAPQSINATEDTIVEDFNLEIDWNDSMALYRERVAMRRYTEEKRIVIVWRELSDTLRIADEPTDGVRFMERGYIVIREDTSVERGDGAAAAATSSSPRIVLQTCYLTAPLSYGILADASSTKIGVVTDFIIGTISANISASFEIIENVLVEQAIKAHWRTGAQAQQQS